MRFFVGLAAGNRGEEEEKYRAKKCGHVGEGRKKEYAQWMLLFCGDFVFDWLAVELR